MSEPLPQYYSETQKIFPKIQRYLNGCVVDVGCNRHKILEDAIGIDCIPYPGVSYVTHRLDDLSSIFKEVELFGQVDVLYSSHCLEHFKDDKAALIDWIKILKPMGLLILYLPDDRHYDNDSNPEHLQRYTYEGFLDIIHSLGTLQVLESGMDVGYDKYSFYVVAQKL
jgi:predicted SAM-dependent methyltransferase